MVQVQVRILSYLLFVMDRFELYFDVLWRDFDLGKIDPLPRLNS